MKQLLALDLGGTRFRVAAFAGDQLLARDEADSKPERGANVVLDEIAQALRKVGAGRGSTAGIGVAAPGPIDPWTGVLYSPPNLPGWGVVDIRQELSRRTGLPVTPGNDANLAAVGEARFGAGKGKRAVCYFTISTGIGGGIVDEGHLVVGGHGFAGEFGHQIVAPGGPPCNCGGRGHLEAVASGTAIGRIARQRLAAGARSRVLELAGGDLAKVSGEEVAAAARGGDPLAVAILDEAIGYLAIGIANVIVTLDPEIVVLGGGVMQAADLFLPPLRERVPPLVIPGLRGRATIEAAALEDDAGLWGAYAVAADAAAGTPPGC